MFRKLFGKKEAETFKNFLAGRLLAIEEVPDQVFSTKMLGDGYAIDPSDSKVYAPLSGKVETLFPSGHAVGVKTDDGLEFLIHLGIDTVSLNGEGFAVHIRQGDTVKQGDLLITVDWEVVKSKDLPTTSILVFTSGESVTLQKEANSGLEALEEDFLSLSKES